MPAAGRAPRQSEAATSFDTVAAALCRREASSRPGGRLDRARRLHHLACCDFTEFVAIEDGRKACVESYRRDEQWARDTQRTAAAHDGWNSGTRFKRYGAQHGNSLQSLNRHPDFVRLQWMAVIDRVRVREGAAGQFLWRAACHDCREQQPLFFAVE